MRKLVSAKLHGIYVTDANLNYHGSITLDPEHCEAAGIFPLEFVDIWNKQSGARISTYVITGKRGSRVCCLNGATARTCQIGDQLIICASIYARSEEIYTIKPRILTFNTDNSIRDRLFYVVSRMSDGAIDFALHHCSSEEHIVELPLKTMS